MDRVDKILAQWNRERPELEVGPMGLIGRISRLSLILRTEMERTWAKFDLNPASFDVLATLRRSGPPYRLSPGDLIASTMVTSGTMTNRIDKLVAAGLVERTPNPEDGRGFLIGLSGKGFSLIDEAVTAHVETQRRLLAVLTEGERTQLDGALRAFLEKIDVDDFPE